MLNSRMNREVYAVMNFPALYKREKTLGRKEQKAQQVLFGLLELYICEGKPVGSQTLKEQGFDHLSSATIRNYFSYLESEGLLEQSHTSGGRSPTDAAWRLYVNSHLQDLIPADRVAELQSMFSLRAYDEDPSRAIIDILQSASAQLSCAGHCASFVLTPHFKHDSPKRIKLWPIHTERTLCITVSQLGITRHESLNLDLTDEAELGVIERYIEGRMQDPCGSDPSVALSSKQRDLAQAIYNELMVRHLVEMTQEGGRKLLKSGLANLLHHSELSTAEQLAPALTFFESERSHRLLDEKLQAPNSPMVWIGGELAELELDSTSCALIACGFAVGPKVVGAIGVLTPKRTDYRKLIESVEHLSRLCSHILTRHYFTHRIDLQEGGGEGHERTRRGNAHDERQTECS